MSNLEGAVFVAGGGGGNCMGWPVRLPGGACGGRGGGPGNPPGGNDGGGGNAFRGGAAASCGRTAPGMDAGAALGGGGQCFWVEMEHSSHHLQCPCRCPRALLL
eukprot:scaffold431_cov334-Pavlova_lutheri.AAC.89